MPWRSPSRLRSEPGAAARQAPFAGGRLLTVMMPRGYYRPEAVTGHPIRIAVVRARRYAYEMSARLVASPRKAGDCCLSCIVIVCFAQFLFSFVRRLPLPRGDEGPTQVGGQALDKARGRKPRNEARPFSRGVALWAFERRPIAQVRDVRGAAPGAACCVKALPALGCAGEVRAARLVM